MAHRSIGKSRRWSPAENRRAVKHVRRAATPVVDVRRWSPRETRGPSDRRESRTVVRSRTMPIDRDAVLGDELDVETDVRCAFRVVRGDVVRPGLILDEGVTLAGG